MTERLGGKENETGLNIDNFSDEPSEEIKHLLNILSHDPDFERELDKLMGHLVDSNLDLSALQSKIILLINSAMQKLFLKQYVKKMLDEFEANGESMKHNLRELSLYLLKKHSQLVREAMSNISDSKDKNAFLDSKSLKHIRDIIKRFAIYEIYKMMNPRRIAGETAKDNFISNVFLYGLKVAMRYEGGSESEIRQYGPNLLKEIARQRKKFLGRGLF